MLKYIVRDSGGKKMTIKDLAKLTGYSVGTVSRVLNNHPNVSEKARRMILRTVKETNFQVNDNAKQLKQQHATSILVVVKGTSNQLFGELVEAIQKIIATTQYPLVVDYVDESNDEVMQAVQLCRTKKPLGVLFLGGNSQNFENGFKQIEVPAVVLTNNVSHLHIDNLSSVAINDWEAAHTIIELLLEQGHRNIAVVGGIRDSSDVSYMRYKGCKNAFQEHNVNFDEECDYLESRFSYRDGYDATWRLLQNHQKFTALFAVADVIAIGAIRAIRDYGLRVPEDISVVGFDGLPLGSYLVPQLSTVEQPVQLIAEHSVEILIDAIENGAPAQHVVVPYTVHKRESMRSLTK